MGEYMDEASAELLGTQVAPTAGRVTWLVGKPGTGISRVLAACVRQAALTGTAAFVWDPQMAHGGDGLPDGTSVLYGNASLAELNSVAITAASQGCGLVALGSLGFAERGDRSLEQGLYDASGGLRAAATNGGRPVAALLVVVHEPLEGFEPMPAGKTRNPRAFAFPFGEGFEGDRVVRLTPAGTIEELRP